MKVIAFLIALLAGGPEAFAGTDAAIALPWKDWAVALDLNGFELASDEARPDARARKRFFVHENGRYNLTIVLKPAQPGVGAEVYRDERWARLRPRFA